MSPQQKLFQNAPTFSLLDAENNTHTLAQYAGSYIMLVFYPGDMTPGCTIQLCALRDEWSKLKNMDCVIFGVNKATAESHKIFSEKYTIPFPLLVDVSRKTAKAFGAICEFLGLKLTRRTVVVIGRDGKIIFYKHGMPKVSEMIRCIQDVESRIEKEVELKT